MFLNFLYPIPGLIFVINILLFIFVSASAGTYGLWPLVAILYLFQVLYHCCMNPTVDIRILNTLHSHQQHAGAKYISVCVMRPAGTSVYISYDQLQQVRQPHCKNCLSATKRTSFIRTLCTLRIWNFKKISNGSWNTAQNLEDLSNKLVLNMERT
jgi:hypothetical protein